MALSQKIGEKLEIDSEKIACKIGKK